MSKGKTCCYFTLKQSSTPSLNEFFYYYPKLIFIDFQKPLSSNQDIKASVYAFFHYLSFICPLTIRSLPDYLRKWSVQGLQGKLNHGNMGISSILDQSKLKDSTERHRKHLSASPLFYRGNRRPGFTATRWCYERDSRYRLGSSVLSIHSTN